MVSAPAVQPPAPIDPKKSKKQKQKSQPTDTRPESIQQEKKKRKKLHDGVSVSEAEATEAGQVMDESAERPTKRQKEVEPETPGSEDQPTAGPEGASPKKPKREKRPKKPKDKSKGLKEEVSNPIDKIQIVDVPVPYTNPLTDKTLSDLTQRGLAYAYQYTQHVSLTSDSERAAKQAWKFNKARQNWLLRNITDPTVIPDSYLPISLIYINSIQGGARNELRKTCKATKKQAKASKGPSLNDQSKPESEVDQSPDAAGESAKKVTFAAGTAEPATAETGVTAPSKIKVKRARTVLKVLKGKIQPQDI
ncbi:unnamed protein product [Rhizoctonia solani]|uniref:WKF domain-containing protein n=1 Tax=Rhizoctonia solani TaxID=456999 RepID=A0A8H3BJ20_9AGAM|nr:unnamed protein product [Rhizoctonia solani]